MNNDEFINDFIEESLGYVEILDEEIVKISKSNIDDISRAVHSIKGTAGFFKLDKIVQLSHLMETLFEKIKESKINIEEDLVNVLIESKDVLYDLIKIPDRGKNINIDRIVERLNNFLTNPAVNIPDKTVYSNIDNIKQFKSDDYIKVKIKVLNNLMNHVNEMVLARNQLMKKVSNDKNIKGLDIIVENINRNTSCIQRDILQTRMKTLYNIFKWFPKLVNNISAKLDKEVTLRIEGEDIEVDKSIIDDLTEPVTHIITNAVSHGIESKSDRINAGKSKKGYINIKAFQESGYIVIRISDDGKGIDPKEVREKIIKQNILKTDEVDLLPENEILNYIFKQG